MYFHCEFVVRGGFGSIGHSMKIPPSLLTSWFSFPSVSSGSVNSSKNKTAFFCVPKKLEKDEKNPTGGTNPKACGAKIDWTGLMRFRQRLQMATEKTVVVVQKGKNYTTWKIQVKMVLMKDNNLLKIVDGTDEGPALADVLAKFNVRKERRWLWWYWQRIPPCSTWLVTPLIQKRFLYDSKISFRRPGAIIWWSEKAVCLETQAGRKHSKKAC